MIFLAKSTYNIVRDGSISISPCKCVARESTDASKLSFEFLLIREAEFVEEVAANVVVFSRQPE